MQGLDSRKAAELLATIGANEMPAAGGRSITRIVAETMREPMFLLLACAAGLYLALGDLGEGLFLSAAAAVSIGLVIVQEARSERALTALRELAHPTARVVRDGTEREIPVRHLVPGDLLLLGEGERVPADGLLVGGDVLSVDESALTGESAPVAKPPASGNGHQAAEPRPGAESSPHLFAGTLVVRGQGVVQVMRTGPRSALGRIGASLAEITRDPTPLQQKAGRLVGLLGIVAIGFSGFVVLAYGLLRDDWIGGALSGLTVAISLIPEEFPLVLAIFLAMGAWRLATHNVLTRRSAVIEALGGATVLCVDKTGTLTENRMAVARVHTAQGDFEIGAGADVPPTVAEVIRVGKLASAVRPVDPMDKALQASAERLEPLTTGPDGEPERIWPLRPELMAVIQVWKTRDGTRLAAAKGAPEAIFRLCRLPSDRIERLQEAIQSYATRGLRVLGVACARSDGAFADEPQSATFRFLGLVGFVDPLRAEVPKALTEARRAGIRVIMITGDHPATALAVARAAGLDTSDGVALGTEIAAWSSDALRQRLATCSVLARIAPDQKLRIVEALKADGEVVAMTGDGINDAPAVQAAHIGVAMGRKGTDVAREAADLVLLDDSFASIVGGVRLGRRIFANLRRALSFVTAVHVPVAGLAILPILVGLPPILLPMHVVLLEMIIDPTCSLVFETEPSEHDAMKQPPRPREEPLFGPIQVIWGLIQGAGLLAAVFGLYWWALPGQDVPEPAARGAAMLALVVGILVMALAGSVASGHLFATHRRTYWVIAILVALVLVVIFSVPTLAAMFRITIPAPELLLTAIGVGVLGGAWFRTLTLLGSWARRVPQARP